MKTNLEKKAICPRCNKERMCSQLVKRQYIHDEELQRVYMKLKRRK